MKLGFTMNHGNFISETIVFFTKSVAKKKPYISHSFPIIDITRQEKIELALSADEILINLINVDRYRGKKDYSVRLYEIPEINNIWRRQLINSFNQKVYPHFELLWFIYRWIRRKINPEWTGKNWFNYSAFCSELTIIALKKAGYSEYFKNIDPNCTDAIELENIILKIEGVKLVEEWIKGERIL